MEQPVDIDESPVALRQAGERIETLLEASSAGGVVARDRADELVRVVAELYGAGLARVLRILEDSGALTPAVQNALVGDDLVASLLLVHGLHPQDVQARVESALESVRPYLGTHGGDVELIDVSNDGVVQLRLLGSCDGCPSSSATLELAVESAVEAAAPEVTAINVVSGAKPRSGQAVIPISALRTRLGDADRAVGRWEKVPELAELAAGEVGGYAVGGQALLVCRIGSDVFAFADHCPRCESTMAGARLERRAGQPVGSGVLTCPTCRCHFDVRGAGASIDAPGAHLQPFPVLIRDGVLSIALPAEPESAVAG
jgi:Fe-S cluster biogenesis protein NfuA/nitrite reductase/ring-hydroxylating ferredoxin subunit